jgi:hypothetical protein
MLFSRVKALTAIVLLMLCPGGLWLSAWLSEANDGDWTEMLHLRDLVIRRPSNSSCRDAHSEVRGAVFISGSRRCDPNASAALPTQSVRPILSKKTHTQKLRAARNPSLSSPSTGLVCVEQNALLLFHFFDRSDGSLQKAVPQLRRLAYSFITDSVLPACDVLFLVTDVPDATEALLDLPMFAAARGASGPVRLLQLREYVAAASSGYDAAERAVMAFSAKWLLRHHTRYHHISIGVARSAVADAPTGSFAMRFAVGADPAARFYSTEGLICAAYPAVCVSSAPSQERQIWLSGNSDATTDLVTAVASLVGSWRDGDARAPRRLLAELLTDTGSHCNSTHLLLRHDVLLFGTLDSRQEADEVGVFVSRGLLPPPPPSPINTVAAGAFLKEFKLASSDDRVLEAALAADFSSQSQGGGRSSYSGRVGSADAHSRTHRAFCHARNAVVLVVDVGALEEAALQPVVAGHLAVFRLHFSPHGCHDLVMVFVVQEADQDLQTKAVWLALKESAAASGWLWSNASGAGTAASSRVAIRVTRAALSGSSDSTRRIAAAAVEVLFEWPEMFRCVAVLPLAASPTHVFVLSNVMQTVHCEQQGRWKPQRRQEVLLLGCGDGAASGCADGIGRLIVGPPHAVLTALRQQQGGALHSAHTPSAKPVFLAFREKSNDPQGPPFLRRLAAVVFAGLPSTSPGAHHNRRHHHLVSDPLWPLWRNHTCGL